jgi:hypothetical protein
MKLFDLLIGRKLANSKSEKITAIEGRAGDGSRRARLLGLWA